MHSPPFELPYLLAIWGPLLVLLGVTSALEWRGKYVPIALPLLAAGYFFVARLFLEISPMSFFAPVLIAVVGLVAGTGAIERWFGGTSFFMIIAAVGIGSGLFVGAATLAGAMLLVAIVRYAEKEWTDPLTRAWVARGTPTAPMVLFAWVASVIAELGVIFWLPGLIEDFTS